MAASNFVERRRLRARYIAFSFTTILCSGLAAPAFAQTSPPQHVDVDSNGVDLVSGSYVTTVTEGTIGSGEGAVSLTRTRNGLSNWVSNWTGGLAIQTVAGVTTAYVISGESSDAFSVSGTSYTSLAGTGSTLAATSGGYTYTASDGTKILYVNQDDDGNPISGFACIQYSTNCSIPVQIIKPSGMTFTIDWTYSVRCSTRICSSGTAFYRLNSVTSSAGYGFTVQYASNAAGTGGAPQTNWYNKTAVVFGNAQNPPASPPVVSYPTPSSSYPDFTDPAGRAWHFGGGNNLPLTSIQRPGASTASTSISYSGTPSYVSSITIDGVTTNYSRVVSGSTATTTITDALGHQKIAVADLTMGLVTQITDILPTGNRVTAFTYDSNGRLTEVVNPEGDKVDYGYDARGNVISSTRKAKPGSGLADIVTTAAYPPSCANIACNNPTSTVDALNHQTDFAYDSATGFLTSVKGPAAVAGGPPPETRYSYTAISGVTLLTGVSSCQTGAAPSCVGTSDELKKTFNYNSNFLISSASTGAGDGSLTTTVSATYDAVGNLATVDGPLPGTDDTTIFRYNADRDRVGIISPDPDGAGPLKRRAVKTTYNNDGQPTVTEIGTVAGTSDSDWAAFASIQQSTDAYDSNARKASNVVTAGGITYSLAQYSYDAVGRPECTALRMNSAAWGSLPSSACSVGASGPAGPDRISKTTYDGAGEVTKTQSAYGTADQADEATASYNGNGTLATLTDAQNNRTSYGYDGFDRQVVTYFPSAAAGSGASSPSDYEQLGYDANGNVTSRRLRDGQTIGFNYDALNRVTYKDLPGSEQDVSYSYDLLNRPVTVSRPDGVNDTFAYDALGRMTSNTQAFGSLAWQYDLAGRRTQTSWNDGFFVNYDYLVTGEVSAVRENGATSGIGVLARYSYDDLGRRTGIARGNGTTSGYGYDGASRLSSLTQDLAGTTYDLTFGFGYNPAGQIASLTRSNDGYAWGGAVNRNDASSVNGLNQVTTVGAGSLGYDGRGNLASTGSTTFGYTSENRLASTNTGVSLYYDGLGRLAQYDTSVSTRFAYDGNQIASEVANPGGTILKRYIYGPGNDEPLVEYDRSGSGYTRTWLHADEHGSIIAQTNDGGAVTGVNSYDEYGVPGAGNVGRFGYTGQAYLPELGLWYYKARMYSSRLGRFLQTDPIGYGDGLNWYNYVGGDPVNGIDPSGLCAAGEALVIAPHINEPGKDDGEGGVVVTAPKHYCLRIHSDGGGGGNGGPGRSPGRGQPTPPPPPQSQPCSAASNSSGASGVWLGASAEAGLGHTAGGGQASISRLRFDGGQIANYFTRGSVRSNLGVVFGAAAGAGGGLSFSNASQVSDLLGDAMTYNVNVGLFSGSLSMSGRTFSLNLGLAKGIGLDFSRYRTQTTLISTGCDSRR